MTLTGVAVAAVVLAQAVCGLNSNLHSGTRRQLQVLSSADSSHLGDQTYEVCQLNDNGNIIDCTVYSEEQLLELAISMKMRDPSTLTNQRGGEDLIFSVPNVGAQGNSLMTMDDFSTCAKDELCVVPADVMNKAFGPDVVSRLQEEEDSCVEADDACAIPSDRSARYHVHFGAGRLGLGLVVPAIAASGLPFAIVQRPKPRWQEVFASGVDKTHVDLAVNNEVKVRKAEVISAVGTPTPESLPSQALIFGSEPRDLQTVLRKGTSFSCSLGAAMGKVMAGTLGALPEVMSVEDLAIALRREQQEKAAERRKVARKQQKKKIRKVPLGTGLFNFANNFVTTTTTHKPEPHADVATNESYYGELSPESDPRPVLYCMENDHAAVAKLKEKLKTRVRVVDCMVDKVCMGRRIEPSGVEIEAEPWMGSIVILEPGFTKRQVPFAPAYVSLPASKLEADYLSKRKFSLVNGMHTVVAFVTLAQTYSAMDPGREYVLLKYGEMSRHEQLPLEAWRTARIAQLLDDFGSADVAKWALQEADTTDDDDEDAPVKPAPLEEPSREVAWDRLLDFADEVLLDRFSAVDDLVSRVLGGGVANRWQTRLVPVKKWLADGPSNNLDRDELLDFVAYAAKRDSARAASRKEEHDEEVLEKELTPEQALSFVESSVSNLVKESRTFCSKELEITNKILIKEQRKAGGKKNSPTVKTALEEVSRRREEKKEEKKTMSRNSVNI